MVDHNIKVVHFKNHDIHTMRYYSVLQINELPSHVGILKKGIITRAEKSQSGKATYCMIPAMTFFKGKTMETVKTSVVFCGMRGRKRWSTEDFRAVKIL